MYGRSVYACTDLYAPLRAYTRCNNQVAVVTSNKGSSHEYLLRCVHERHIHLFKFFLRKKHSSKSPVCYLSPTLLFFLFFFAFIRMTGIVRWVSLRCLHQHYHFSFFIFTQFPDDENFWRVKRKASPAGNHHLFLRMETVFQKKKVANQEKE